MVMYMCVLYRQRAGAEKGLICVGFESKYTFVMVLEDFVIVMEFFFVE